ncbi:hypothetical protein V5E97_00745 [Singulisphaera sp. Ch08]|uniref:Uncharacterized protein n=1 Tax=Singulisphaera sp. Ch08 TaxID=3120278 RepID=A0AAU7CH70_9BACT
MDSNGGGLFQASSARGVRASGFLVGYAENPSKGPRGVLLDDSRSWSDSEAKRAYRSSEQRGSQDRPVGWQAIRFFPRVRVKPCR